MERRESEKFQKSTNTRTLSALLLSLVLFKNYTPR